MKRAYGVLIVLLALITSAFAQKPEVITSNESGWQKIGETTASFDMQTESIIVLGADKFSNIKLKVTDAPITIERLQVVYESGEVEEIEVLNKLNEGAETRSIEIKGDEDIQKVVFTYRTVTNAKNEKSHVELHGLKTRAQNSDAYRSDVNQAAQETREDASEAAEKTDKEIDKAADDAKREINETANEVDSDIEKAAENTDEAIKPEAKETEGEVKTGVDKATDEISETAANASAEVNDQTYSGKMGPQGQNIYIDKNDKYYYINNEGKKIYISKSALKDKPKNDK